MDGVNRPEASGRKQAGDHRGTSARRRSDSTRYYLRRTALWRFILQPGTRRSATGQMSEQPHVCLANARSTGHATPRGSGNNTRVHPRRNPTKALYSANGSPEPLFQNNTPPRGSLEATLVPSRYPRPLRNQNTSRAGWERGGEAAKMANPNTRKRGSSAIGTALRSCAKSWGNSCRTPTRRGWTSETVLPGIPLAWRPSHLRPTFPPWRGMVTVILARYDTLWLAAVETDKTSKITSREGAPARWEGDLRDPSS